MKKFLFFLAIIIFLFPQREVFASDLEVTCIDTGCSPASLPSFFTASEVWYPGKTLSKSIKVINNSGSVRSVSGRSQNQTSTGNIDTVMNLAITRSQASGTIWQGTLNNFYNAGKLYLSDIANSASEEYIYLVKMDDNAGNEFQGKTTSFDLVISVNQTTSTSPTNSPSPTISPSPTPTDVPGPTSTPEPGPTSTPGPGPTDTPGPTASPTPLLLSGLSTSVPTLEPFPTENILGTGENPTPTPAGEVLGETVPVGAIQCLATEWFLLLLTFQAIAHFISVRLLSEREFMRVNILQTIVILAALLFSARFCNWEFIIISGLMGVTSLIFSYLKITFSSSSLFRSPSGTFLAS